MTSWFSFAGVVSASLGVIVQELPPLTLSEERVEFKPVLGKSGSYTMLDGDNVYEDIVQPVKCCLTDAAYQEQVIAWLRGRGGLILGNMPNRYYDARCINQLELKQVLRNNPHRSFSAVFRCKPYRYHYPAIAPYALANGGTITNPGTIDAEPMIVITGSGNIALTLGDKVIEISGLTGSITIDTAYGIVYRTGSNPLQGLFGSVSSEDWPFTLPPGDTVVGWTGTVTGVTLEPNWRDI